MQKKTEIRGILVILACLMSILFAANAFAQDAQPETNETQKSVVYHETKYEFDIGIGEGSNVSIFDIPVISANVGLFINANSFWRPGFDFNFLMTVNWVHNDYYNTSMAVLFLNEFTVYRGGIFEFAPRLGLGYRYENRQRDDEYSSDADYHMFAANFGLGFDWRVSQLVSLGFNVDYILSTVLNEPESYYGYPEIQKGDLEHTVLLKFNVGFHI